MDLRLSNLPLEAKLQNETIGWSETFRPVIEVELLIDGIILILNPSNIVSIPRKKSSQ